MNQTTTNEGIRCKECNYEGAPKTNSGNAFILFFIMLCSSVFFLPMIVVALAYMGWIITKPAKKSCPQCKSSNIEELAN